MEQKSMTALVSAFSRAYHSQHAKVPVFDDSTARALISDEDTAAVSAAMAGGIKFFKPDFEGGADEALEWVVNNYLAPSPLGRAAFAEAELKKAAAGGTSQYIILAAGYDTFAYRRPDWAKDLRVFELDHPATSEDKRLRAQKATLTAAGEHHAIAADFTQKSWERALLACESFDAGARSFCSALGLLYYLPQSAFENMLAVLSGFLPTGSALAFDYPDERSFTPSAGERAKKQAMLAKGAGEEMLTGYSEARLRAMLSAHGFAARELLTPDAITAQYFNAHNLAEPDHPITAFDNVNYCLAVKK